MKNDGTGFWENISGAIRIGLALMTPFLRGWRIRHGVTHEEFNSNLPGDNIVAAPKWQYLHGITVNAPAHAIWPWIAQIGQGRGGFYSYQRLENLAGCKIVNADKILHEFQNIAVGDGIKLHPDGPPLEVAIVEPGRALVLNACADMRTGEKFNPALPGPRPENYVNITWALIIQEIDAGHCRLFSRDRVDHGTGRLTRFSNGPLLIEPISYAMDTKMLKVIKARVEASVH
jgi:hypothetical protein